MRLLSAFIVAFLLLETIANAQDVPDNIYKIRKQIQDAELPGSNQKDGDEDTDNEANRFDRWYHFMEPRCYPTGDIPKPSVLLDAYTQSKKTDKMFRTTGSYPQWQPIGPKTLSLNYNGIGRVNCIVIDPNDTNTLYIGTAGGGVFISHNGGTSWKSNSDNFPALSVADIAVNPHNTDTIYAATGDEYGYEVYAAQIFWGGLYSAGVMMSADGGNTWNTTGLSYLQSNRDIIQRLLIHPDHPNILLAGTRHGIYRTTDAGTTWTLVDPGHHVYDMEFYTRNADTVYATTDSDLRVSYNAGATWTLLCAGINTPVTTGVAPNRTSLAVSSAAPDDVWVIDNTNKLKHSVNKGVSFSSLGAPMYASFYGYYDRVLAVCPGDANNIITAGLGMGQTKNGGASWRKVDTFSKVHPDNHAITFNPQNPNTFYSGNDGGIFRTRDGGINWTNLSDSLMISQIYRMSSSRQKPSRMICGIQDNGSWRYDSSLWRQKIGADGEGCAISPSNDSVQLVSSQYGTYYISKDQGNTFTYLSIPGSGSGTWTTPAAFNPNNADSIYFAYKSIYVTYNRGLSFINLTPSSPKLDTGGIAIIVAPTNTHVIYAADSRRIIRTTNGGASWLVVTGNLPSDSCAITDIAVDYKNPLRVFVTTSGYKAGKKIFLSDSGGVNWTNISYNLPNIPANCVVVDSSVNGSVYVGTDLGVYYIDSNLTSWASYSNGLPCVIVDDMEINYPAKKLRIATYGRGLWECDLNVDTTTGPNKIGPVSRAQSFVDVYPNPTNSIWKLIFNGVQPSNYTVTISDMNGRSMYQRKNIGMIDVSGFPKGNYIINISAGNKQYLVKGVVK